MAPLLHLIIVLAAIVSGFYVGFQTRDVIDSIKVRIAIDKAMRAQREQGQIELNLKDLPRYDTAGEYAKRVHDDVSIRYNHFDPTKLR